MNDQSLFIKNIRSSRFPNRVYLHFSNEIFFPLNIDDIYLLKISKDQEVDSSKFDRILEASIFYILKESGLRQIANSPKSRKQLWQKLKISSQKYLQKYTLADNHLDIKNIIDKTILYFSDQGLLDDESFIKYFIRKNQHKSQKEIGFLLDRQGIGREVYSKFLSPKNDRQVIQKILSKKKFDPSKLSDFHYKNKIFSFLYRKGFSLSDIRFVIDGGKNFL